MPRMLRSAVSALAFAILAGVGVPSPACADMPVVCTNCSTTWTQLLEYGKQLQQVQTQLQQYATQLQQYANMVQNTVAVPTQIYSSARSDMQSVQSLMTQGSQLSFGNTGSSMGTFSSFLNNTSSLPNDLTAQANQFATWSTRAKDGITAAMTAVGAQNSQLSTDDATMQALQAQNGAATGQMQAMQNSAQIAAQGARETEKLRQLVMVQVQLEANKQQNDSEQTSQSEAAWQKFRQGNALDDTGQRY